jgi:hypothetical protein
MEICLEKVLENCHNGIYSDEELLQFIEVIAKDYLGMITIANKAKELKTDYNNVKCSSHKKINFLGVKFVIDNE